MGEYKWNCQIHTAACFREDSQKTQPQLIMVSRLKLSRCPLYKVTQSTLIAVTVPLERPEIKCFA